MPKASQKSWMLISPFICKYLVHPLAYTKNPLGDFESAFAANLYRKRYNHIVFFNIRDMPIFDEQLLPTFLSNQRPGSLL